MENKTNPDASTSNTGRSFTLLPLKKALLTNLTTLKHTNMTEIQALSLPWMLKGFDVIAQAKTGSGKTATFGLTLLNRLDIEQNQVQTLVLCPTRELAEQVCQELRRLARLMSNIKILNLSGGMPLKAQLDSLNHGAHIIVGTPGRVQKHLEKKSLNLSYLSTLVFDEADRMLEMGFLPGIQNIASYCPKKRQTLLFSATYPEKIQQVASQFMQTPKHLVAKETESSLDISQIFYELSHPCDKYPLLKKLLLHHTPKSALIFCNTKAQTTNLAIELAQDGFNAFALNGDMDQKDRDLAVIRFANGSCNILVATDVAARGLDIKELPMIINYELAFEPDVHIHRIGRTGRAGCKGIALSLSIPSDAARICAIEDHMKKSVQLGNARTLLPSNTKPRLPEMKTLCLSAGRKDKIRAGDILGALTKDGGLPGTSIGKIQQTSLQSFVAIKTKDFDKAYRYIQSSRIKRLKITVKKV